ncbi:MAG: HIT domain-containing protein [Candidatus Competibacterales bacterium]|nr:HIT domain-containing protein [Candidatus Competibacterales bacterium]
MTGPCPFCRIIAGQTPAATVLADDHVMAIMDRYPAAEGHVLIVSRRHHEQLHDLDDATLTAVALASRRIAQAIRETLQPAGLRVTQANGAAAGQTVFHYHLHLLPVYPGQGRRSHGSTAADPARLDTLAAWLRAALPID